MRKRRTCRKGHPITGWNVSWHTVRGTRRRRCRTCYNASQRTLMRRRRKEAQ